MTIQEMRALSKNSSVNESTDSTYIDKVKLLSETYVGSEAVDKIQSAMDTIYKVVKENPDKNLNGTREEMALEKAVRDCFGFKQVYIYWSNDVTMRNGGPATYTGSILMHSSDPGFMYGESKHGFYDKDHKVTVLIQMDSSLIHTMGLTSREMTALLLHEIGHNFEFTPATLVNSWYLIAVSIGSLNVFGVAGGVLVDVGKEYVRIPAIVLQNIDDIVINKIPPIGKIVRSVGKVSYNVMKIIAALLSPISVMTMIPVTILLTPFCWLGSYLSRTKEVYADSFAAAYGYSSEVATSLEKISKYGVYSDYASPTGILKPFYELQELQYEIVVMCMGGHRTNQQRMISMIDSMKQSLNDPDLPKSLKPQLTKDIEQAEATYRRICNMDKKDHDTLVTIMRKEVDSWYAGKPYIFIKNSDQQYAK